MKKIIKLYTKTGDKGESGLVDGKRTAKSDLVFEVLGGVDEANSLLGLVVAQARKIPNSKHQTSNNFKIRNSNYQNKIIVELMRVQNNLLTLGAMVAGSDKVEIKESDVEFLEERIDYYQKNTREDWYTKFLLPGGTELAARIDVARAVCRRVERVAVQFKVKSLKLKVLKQRENFKLVSMYLNRLSDYLFALRCYVNSVEGYEEVKFEV